MPTLPSQGDILQTKYGSHGDYNPIVIYPNSVEECYRYAIEVFNAAEESRSPVILLLDGFLGHLSETVDLDSIKVDIKERTLEPLGKGTRHFTGLLCKGDIPVTKDSVYYNEWYARVKDKMKKASDNYRFYEYIENEKSDTLIIAYGIMSRTMLSLKDKYSIFRPITIFPMLDKELKEISNKYKRIFVVEMNDGQYKGEVEKILKRDIDGISVMGGTINLPEIEKQIK